MKWMRDAHDTGSGSFAVHPGVAGERIEQPLCHAMPIDRVRSELAARYGSPVRAGMRLRGGACDQVLRECAASPATARRGLVGEAVDAGPLFLVHGDEEAGGIEAETVAAVERNVARPQPARDGHGLCGVGSVEEAV